MTATTTYTLTILLFFLLFGGLSYINQHDKKLQIHERMMRITKIPTTEHKIKSSWGRCTRNGQQNAMHSIVVVHNNELNRVIKYEFFF